MGQTFAVTLPFFALVACGYLAARRQLLGEGAVQGINLFVFYFALPALLFRSTATRPLADLFEPTYALAYLLAGLAVFVLTALGGRLLFRLSLSECAIQGQAGSVGNVGFLALPLLLGVMGPEAAPPILLGWMIDLIVLVPAAIAIIEISRHRGDAVRWPALFAKVMRGVIVNPFVLSILAGVLYSAFGLPMIKAIDSFTHLLGQAAGPAALFALGATLAGRPLSENLGEAGYLSLAKLALHPALMWIAMTYVFAVDPFWAIAATLVAAAPIAGNVYVIASSYSVYAVRASSAILISTGLAVISFSALVAWLLTGHL